MTERDKAGKWKPGQSGNPGGRSGQTQELRARLAEGAEAVTRKVLTAAKKGDMQACRLILERLVPPIKPTAETVRFVRAIENLRRPAPVGVMDMRPFSSSGAWLFSPLADGQDIKDHVAEQYKLIIEARDEHP